MSGDPKVASDDAERRAFFRVDDSVSLSYHVISRDELDNRKSLIEMEHEGNFTVMSSIASINQNMAGIMHRIEGGDPDIAAYLKAINSKIDILGRALLSNGSELATQPAQPVNISASGLAFYSSDPVEKGSLLELKLLLMSSFTGIITFGEVVGCDAVDDADGYSHFIRLSFMHMREQDRDLLIRHVIKRQSEFLRRRRESREDD